MLIWAPETPVSGCSVCAGVRCEPGADRPKAPARAALWGLRAMTIEAHDDVDDGYGAVADEC